VLQLASGSKEIRFSGLERINLLQVARQNNSNVNSDVIKYFSVTFSKLLSSAVTLVNTYKHGI
jgi:hypothetical protein